MIPVNTIANFSQRSTLFTLCENAVGTNKNQFEMITSALASWVAPTIQVMCSTMRNVGSEDARELNAGTIETLQATDEAGLRKTLDRKMSEQRRAYVCYACVVKMSTGYE